jgi:hypothetical protein
MGHRLQHHETKTPWFRGVLALNGFALAMGVLLVLRYARIPFFIYYPRVVETVLLSDSLDLYAFLAASICVPAALGLVALRSRIRGLPRDVLFTHLAVVAIWLASLFLLSASPPASVAVLFSSIVANALLNVLDAQLVFGLTRRGAVSTMILPVATIFALIEFAPVYYWGFASLEPLTQVGRGAAELEMNVTYALFPLAPLILFAVLFSWLWVPVALRIVKVKNGVESTGQRVDGSIDRRTLAVTLDLVLILSIIVFYFSYFAGQSWIVGVDSIMNYVDPLVRMSGMQIGAALSMLALTFHGVYVAILYAIQLITGLSPFVIVKFAPLVLAVLTALTTFWVFHSFGRSYRLAVLCALCSILWIPTAWGIFAGLQANWTAVWLWMLFLALMQVWLKRPRGGWILLVLQAVVSAAMLLIHPWTWGLFAGTLIIFTIITILGRNQAARRSILSLLSSISLAVPAAIAGMLLFPGLRKDLLDTVGLYARPFLNPQRLFLVWSSVLALVQSWSSFLNPTILAICLLGSVQLFRSKGSIGRYLSGWLLVSSVGVVLAGMVGYNPNQPGPPDPLIWRVLYVSPVFVLLASGVEMIFHLSAKLEPANSTRPVRIGEVAIPVGIVAVLSGLLVASSSPVLNLVVVVVALAVTFLVAWWISEPRTVRILVAIIILLVVVNATFRGLYPLLLDPHNLHR